MTEFKDHFSKQAQAYRLFRPRYPEALIDFISEAAPGHSLAWDCGTGNGQVAISLASRFKKVWATDASSEQVAVAPSHPNVSFLVEKAENSSLWPESVDAVTAAMAVHWFDQVHFIREVCRVLKCRGILAIWSYGDPRVEKGIDDAIARFERDALAQFWPEETSNRQLATTLTEGRFVQLQAPRFSIKCDWDCKRFASYVSTWSAYSRALQNGNQDAVHEGLENLAKAWGPSSRSIEWPLTLQLLQRA